MNTRKLVCQLLTTKTAVRRSVMPIRQLRLNPCFHKSRYFSTSFVLQNRLAEQKECWQCQSTNKPSALFCENKTCNVIQSIPSDLDFYDLLQAGTGEKK